MIKKLTIIAAAACAMCAAHSSEIKFDENSEIFENPGQGFSSYSLGFRTDTKVNYGAGYFRFEWAKLQPVEGSYNWEPIDKALEFFSKNGLPFYFRIMCTNYHGGGKYSTPQWVFLKGAKSHEFKGVKYKTPDGGTSDVHISAYFDDPIFMEEHEKFIKALAARYDGDPRLGGLDLGSFGNWGEWHCTSIGLENPNMYGFETRKKYADMYLKNFKKSDIFFMTDDHEVLKYALGNKKKARVGLRRDGIGSPWHFGRWIGKPPYDKIERMADVWKDKPIFFEFYGDVNMLHKNKWDIVFSCDWILKNHVSLVNEIPLHPQLISDDKERAALDDVCRYAGARLVPEKAEVSYADGKLEVSIEGENKGVARIHLPYRMKYELRDSSGKVVFGMLSSQDPRKLLPGKFKFSDTMRVSLKPNETYSLSLRIFHTKKIFRDFKFAVKNLNEDGSLDLGKISGK